MDIYGFLTNIEGIYAPTQAPTLSSGHQADLLQNWISCLGKSFEGMDKLADLDTLRAILEKNHLEEIVYFITPTEALKPLNLGPLFYLSLHFNVCLENGGQTRRILREPINCFRYIPKALLLCQKNWLYLGEKNADTHVLFIRLFHPLGWGWNALSVF